MSCGAHFMDSECNSAVYFDCIKKEQYMHGWNMDLISIKSLSIFPIVRRLAKTKQHVNISGVDVTKCRGRHNDEVRSIYSILQ